MCDPTVGKHITSHEANYFFLAKDDTRENEMQKLFAGVSGVEDE